MEKTLKLYKYVDGGINDTPFPNAEDHIEIGAFRYNAQRMGAAPTITATILFGSCLDKVWTNQVYVEFNGEKFYLKQTPTSSFDNEDCRYKHNAEFVSERVILDNVYFYDAVKPGQSNVDDKPKSNSTKFSFWGDVNEFAKRLSASLLYSGLDYHVIVDDGVASEEKMVEFEDAFFSNAIQEIYNVYKVPYYFVGKVIHIGYTHSELPYPLQYGVDNQLVSITKNNKNNKIVNRITGKGSTENIPFYYPNNSPKGDISAKVTSSSPLATATIVDYDKFSSEIKLDGVIKRVNASYSNVKASHLNTTFSSGSKAWSAGVGPGGISKVFSIEFDSSDVGSIKLDFESKVTKYKLNDAEVKDATISIRYSVTIRKDKKTLLAHTNLSSIQDIELPVSGDGKYSISVDVSYVPTGKYAGKGGQIVYDASYNLGTATGWMYDDKPVDLSKIGLEVSGSFSNGDTITQVLEKYVNTSDTLLPSIYRETDGAERFYNALNNTHLLKDGDGYYSFKNEYVDGMPKEHIVSFEDIRPTIKDSVNYDIYWVEGGETVFQRLDMFADFAYDEPDSDETYEDSEDNSNVKYKHGYFFAKLRKLPFNLFDHAIEDQPMTISFTSGSCGACKFKIGVTEEFPHKNPVQVNPDGTLKRDEQGRVICGVHKDVTEFQDSQQDTSKGEVWIALMKEEETYGMLMPKAPVYSNSTLVESGFRPKACSGNKSNNGDEFVILGIHLPKSYILDAEEKLKHELLKYMQENNEEKFSFNIKFSRIYFEENPDILDYLNENSAVTVIYDGGEYSLFVKSFSYSMSEGDILPDISVELDEDLSVGQNAIQNAISAVQSEVGNAMQAVQATMSMQKRMFVQKQTDDTAIGEITFTKGIKLGNGGKVEITEDSAKLYIDFLEVRKKATFTSLEIQEKTHVGGQMIISPASMTCKRVEEIQGSNGDILSYRCYMQTEGEGGEEVANQFVVGDQAICQTFNSLGCKYYWRLVTAVGKDYIELSATDCDTDSGTPAENDKIIQLGHRTNPERQAAQVLSAYGDNAPAFIMYNGINSFSLTDKEVTGVLWNPSKKEPQMFSYGDFFFGDGSTDDEGNLTGQFITYQKKDGDTKKKLHINADVTFGSNSEGLSNLKEWSGLAGTVEEMQTEIENAVTDLVKVNSTLGNLQDQIDGVVENYFLEGMPTINNVPVTDWKGESEDDDNALLNHVGDTYTDITEYIDDEKTPTAGKSWRWCECNSYTIENEVVGPASYYSGDSWVKIGTVPIKDYGSAVLRRSGTICSSFFSFAYNTEIRNNIGRPAYLKVEKSTGDVYIQNFANALESGSYNVQLYVGAVMAQKSDASVVNLHWHPIADSDAVKALLEAAKAQDTANNKRRVFTDSPKGPYDKGDLWSQGVDGDLMVCVSSCAEEGQFFSSDWKKASKYTDDSALSNFIEDNFQPLKAQVDGKIDTWYEGNDPSTSWDDKASHKGDLWYKDGKNYIYNGTAWEFIEGVPQSLYDNVDRKKQVFCEQPTTPYDVGDIWAQGEGGDIMICKSPKVSGNFDASDWVKASNYTDGSNTKNLIPNSRVIKSFRLPQEHYPTGDSTLYYAKIILPIRVNAGETYTFKCEKSKILSGSQTGYRIRIDDGTTGEDGVTNVYSTWGSLSVGDKKYTTITILDGVINKVAYLSIVRQGPSGNSKSDSIVLNNVSLVRGNNPMPVWEDYQGDVGLKNLIDRHPSDAATIVGTTQYSNWDFAHLTVNGGESYTFMAESALATNDTGFNIGLYDAAANKWVNEETFPIYIKNGSYVYGTLNVANTIVTKSPVRQTTISVPAFNNKSLYHIGTIELKDGREYSSISYERGDVYIKDVDFALDTDIQLVSGPPTYIRIEKATGNVYILDQYGYHTQVSLALIFTYTDSTTETVKNKEVKLLVYAGQTPTNGKTLTIKNFSLVKGTTPMMVWKENTDYLTNAFKNGTTTVTGGLVMTQAVMVEDGSGNVKGMLNGSDFAKDDEHGKIILAGGVPKTSQSGSSVLETRVKDATTRIYDDGHIFSNRMYLNQGCKVGEFTLDNTGLKCYGNDRKMNLGYEAIEFGAGSNLSATFGVNYMAYETRMVDIVCNSVSTRSNILRPFVIDADVDESNSRSIYVPAMTLIARGKFGRAIECVQGMYAGLRPYSRVVTSAGTDYLDDYDHTVVYNVASGTVTVYLPSNPYEGQEYDLYTCHTPMDITIKTQGGKNMYDFINGIDHTTAPYTNDKRRHIHIFYAGGQWWESYRYLQP